MEINYMILLLLVFILIILFKIKEPDTKKPSKLNAKQESTLKELQIEAEKEMQAELENKITNKINIENTYPNTDYQLNFYNSPSSPATHLFLPNWNLIQEEAPSNLKCNSLECQSKDNEPSLILIINENDEHEIPLELDYNKLKYNLELYDIDFNQSQTNLQNEIKEDFNSSQDLKQKVNEICNHNTFFTKSRNVNNPETFDYCIKNNPYFHGCITTNQKIGIDNFNAPYAIYSSYLNSIGDKRGAAKLACSMEYQKQLKDLGLCIPGLLKQYSNYEQEVKNNNFKSQFKNHNLQDNKLNSNIIYNTCFPGINFKN